MLELSRECDGGDATTGSKSMERTRFGCSYTVEEVKIVHTVFKTLQRGGDVGMLMRQESLHKVMARFSTMAKKAALEPPMPAPLSKAEREALAQERKKLKYERRNARTRAERAKQRAERFVATLPRAEKFRDRPYVFTQWEKMTIVGMRDLIPNRWLAKYFGVPESTLWQMSKLWEKELAEQSATADDSVPCAAE